MIAARCTTLIPDPFTLRGVVDDRSKCWIVDTTQQVMMIWPEEGPYIRSDLL